LLPRNTDGLSWEPLSLPFAPHAPVADGYERFVAAVWSMQHVVTGGSEMGEAADEATCDPGWMLPLTVLSRVYSIFITTASIDDMYLVQRPLPLKELYDADAERSGLLSLLKFALWHVVWVEAGTGGNGVACLVARFE
jgi:hypothetical protein